MAVNTEINNKGSQEFLVGTSVEEHTNLQKKLADVVFQYGHFLQKTKMENNALQMHFILKCSLTCDKTMQKTNEWPDRWSTKLVLLALALQLVGFSK